MRTIDTLTEMLFENLINSITSIKSATLHQNYYNDLVGNTSVILSAILAQYLRSKYVEWKKEKWIDDSLITGVEFKNEIFYINGVVIWGRMDTTEQWTDPFYFEATLNTVKKTFQKFKLLFGDKEIPSLTYEVFKYQRDYWDGANRNWAYSIIYTGNKNGRMIENSIVEKL
ncbi:MAG: hypothetical protein F9K23_08695 [Bacteroidetes bacterium]|nr:MAG: hypothetical protein F9K23_08695 [Bacteroidota bacterium]